VAAIRAAAEGEFPPSARPAGIMRDLARSRPVLSARERETLSYIARGFTHAQTARRMRVSTATVDTYVARIRAKLQIGNKAELALAALEHVRPLSGESTT